jgi:diguanylate cyclase (GGDEF)-like protein
VSSAERLAAGGEERARMGRISGGLWVVGALVGIVGTFLPGASHEDVVWVMVLSGLVLAYGIGSITGWIPWHRASLEGLAIGMVATIPVVGVAVFLTGASISYIEPLLVCSLLYAAFFFPPRWAWPLTIELLLVAGTPLLYDDRAIEHAYLSRYLALAAGFLAVTGVMLQVKRRLVEAERSQREIANRDALTGVPNRRAFDAAMRHELAVRRAGPNGRRSADAEPLGLLIVDLDDFKSINDVHGHQIGDAVLRGAASRMAAVLRGTDTLARIGGDEFAIIAPGADEEGASRLSERVAAAVASARPQSGLPVPRASIGWSVFPDDARSIETLLHAADERLLDIKHRARRPAPAPQHPSGLSPVA